MHTASHLHHHDAEAAIIDLPGEFCNQSQPTLSTPAFLCNKHTASHLHHHDAEAVIVDLPGAARAPVVVRADR